MKTVKDAITLQANALSITVGDQIERLEELIDSEGDGRAFFEKTYITQGMNTLIKGGMARLAGHSSSAVFHLKQAMGGGKTHLLVGLGLLARHKSLRQAVIGHVPYIEGFEGAKIAAFSGRNYPKEFLWGEIARQLGHGQAFARFWQNGPLAPGESDWLEIFSDNQPTLILLDELPPYFQYYGTQVVGMGTVADIVTTAFANLLSAAGRKGNVCVVLSDLEAAYDIGGDLIIRALENARNEAGRQEVVITPVDLAGDEIYAILRKRLFVGQPNPQVVEEVAARYGQALQEATRGKVIGKGAEAIADEIAKTYPFHPRMKDLIALFKDNPHFKQTRGLLELISRLLKSVWEREDNDVFLIGPQHFDLRHLEVRDLLANISQMPAVMAKDLFDDSGVAHAQKIALSSSHDAAIQVANLLFCASLSKAVNAVKGLSREALAEYLVTPIRGAEEFSEAFGQLEKVAWYLHHNPDGRYYFEPQENLTKMLQDLATNAPDNKIDELIKEKLTEMYRPTRRLAYSSVLPLPTIDQVADELRKGRTLVILEPGSLVPSAQLLELFGELREKNNLCVLTGDQTRMAKLTDAARNLYAASFALEHRISPTHPQRKELEEKAQSYATDFRATVLSLFNKVVFPIQPKGQPASLTSKVLDQTWDITRPYEGEEQIIKTLTSQPTKLYTDLAAGMNNARIKAAELLWPAGNNEVKWSDALKEAECQPGMPWLPPRGLEQVKAAACNEGIWEDLNNGWLTKAPKKRRTSVQAIPEGEPDDLGMVRIRVIAQNAGPSPKIHYALDGAVDTQSPTLNDGVLHTSALVVQFLAVDPSGTYETGDPVTWKNKLVLRNELVTSGTSRKVHLYVAPPGATIRYSTDGREPRDGTEYTGPIEIGDKAVKILAFAEAQGIEARASFEFGASGQTKAVIDPDKPGKIHKLRGQYRLDSRANTYTALEEAKTRGIEFETMTLTVGDGPCNILVTVSGIKVNAERLEQLLTTIVTPLPPDAPLSMQFKTGYFPNGHHLTAFAEKLGIVLEVGEVQQ